MNKILYQHLRTHTRVCVEHARVLETRKERFFALKLGLERISHRLGAVLNPYFQLHKAIHGEFLRGTNSGVKTYKIYWKIVNQKGSFSQNILKSNVT